MNFCLKIWRALLVATLLTAFNANAETQTVDEDSEDFPIRRDTPSC